MLIYSEFDPLKMTDFQKISYIRTGLTNVCGSSWSLFSSAPHLYDPKVYLFHTDQPHPATGTSWCLQHDKLVQSQSACTYCPHSSNKHSCTRFSYDCLFLLQISPQMLPPLKGFSNYKTAPSSSCA